VGQKSRPVKKEGRVKQIKKGQKKQHIKKKGAGKGKGGNLDSLDEVSEG